MASAKEEERLKELISTGKELLEQYRKSDMNMKQQSMQTILSFVARLNDEANYRHDYGKLDDVITLFSLQLEIVRTIKHTQGEGATLNNIGAAFCSMGQYKDAFEYLQQALKLSREIGDEKGEGATLNNIGEVYRAWGRYREALENYEKALEIRKKVGDERGEGATLNNMGLAYGSMGRHQEALEHYQKALGIRKKVGDKKGEGATLNNIGGAYHAWSRYQEALGNYQKALCIAREIRYRTGEGRTLKNIGALYDSWGKYQEALDRYQEALSIAKEVGDRDGEGAATNSIGGVYYSLGSFQEALKQYQQALSIVKEVGNRAGEEIVLNNIGLAHLSLGSFAESFEVLKRAVDLAELLVGEAKSEEIRREFRGTELSTFNATVYLLIKWYRSGGEGVKKHSSLLLEALRFLEMGKAREISDKLEPGSKRVDLSVICPEYRELVAKEQQLTEKLNELYRINEIEGLNIANSRAKGSSANQLTRSVSPSQLAQMTSQLKALRKEIQEQCPDPGLVRQTADFNPIPSFKKLFDVDPGCIIWEFFFPEEQDPHSFVILSWTKIDGIKLFESGNINLDDGLECLSDFHKTLDEGDPTKGGEALAQLSHLLGSWLPAALWQTVSNKDLLIIVPHGKLHLFPWSIAAKHHFSKVGKEDDTHLGLLLPTIRSFSLGIVVSCFNREKKMDNSILFVSNPNFNDEESNLPGSDDEVDSIIKLLSQVSHKPDVVAVLRHEQAAKEIFRSKVFDGPSMIHFAGHAGYDPDDPWMSGLEFYSPNGYTPYSVTEMLLDRFVGSPLFVLSACETARGEIAEGDESVGIIRGLTLAGATTIVATNWLLDDRVAPLFMNHFYRHFLQGEIAAKALFNARKHLFKVEGFEDPADWAVYELYGNPFKRVS